MRTKLFLSILGVFAILATGDVYAQRQYPGYDRSYYASGAYYVYTEQGEVGIDVNVWGTMRNPGLYHIKEGTRFSELLSLAGGPPIIPRGQYQRRYMKVQLIRYAGDDKTVLLEQTYEDEFTIPEVDPVLMAGDAVLVDSYTKTKFNWRDSLPIISTATSVAGILVALLAR